MSMSTKGGHSSGLVTDYKASLDHSASLSPALEHSAEIAGLSRGTHQMDDMIKPAVQPSVAPKFGM